MAAYTQASDKVLFADFELDCRSGELRRNGILLRLQPQPAKVLSILVSRAGEIVTRQELSDQVWGAGTYVDFEHGLNYAIRQIRTVLNEDIEHPRFLETIPKRGYRFITPVTRPVPATEVKSQEPVPATAPRPGKRAWRSRVILFASVGIVATLVLASRWNWFRPSTRRAGKSQRIESLAVLPLENLSRDPDQEFFSEGLTDELITDLARIGGLRVISRTSIMGYRGTSKRIPDIARELRVDGIVEGTLERNHGRVRIRVQLINGRTDEHFWAATYDRDGNDAFLLEAEVASDVAQQIGYRLSNRGWQSGKVTIPTPVYEQYLRGRYYWNKRTPEGLNKAIAQFEEVIKQAPDFALAYSGLADCYNLLAVYTTATPEEALPKAREAALKAITLDENQAAAHASLGEVRFRFEWDWGDAEKEFRRAIELEPNYSTAHHWYAEYLIVAGRFDEGIAEIQKALDLDPLSLIINADAGWFLDMAGKGDRALLQLRRTLELEPRFSPTHLYLAEFYLRRKMYSQAIAECRESANLGDPVHLYLIGYVYSLSGQPAKAKKILDQVLRRSSTSPTSIAVMYGGLGDKDRAFAFLERAFDEHDDSLIYMRWQTIFDPLRSDPRFKILLGRMRFPQ